MVGQALQGCRRKFGFPGEAVGLGHGPRLKNEKKLDRGSKSVVY
jgi:hypothetical protein